MIHDLTTHTIVQGNRYYLGVKNENVISISYKHNCQNKCKIYTMHPIDMGISICELTAHMLLLTPRV